MAVSEDESVYILGADFGSTSLTVKIYDEHADVVSSTSVKVPYLYPEAGAYEIDPDVLWDLFVDIVKATFIKSDIPANRIKAFGFCCQRGTIIFWNKHTGRHCCNFISWQDQRCGNVVARMNQLWMKKSVNTIGAILYTFSRQKKFLLMKALQFQMNQSSMKALWFLDSHPEVKQAAIDGDVLFGTLDTWIMWKLSKGQIHQTDYSNASGTGMWDPYLCEWTVMIPWMFDFPLQMYPEFTDTSGHFFDVHEDIFGAPIPLTAVVADTQATAFGQCCFDVGDASCTLGTGCFVTINTGSYAHASVQGIYPQVGWKLKDELTYLCEGHIAGIATAIEWAKELDIYDDVNETSDIAKSVEDSGGIFFVPAFAGLSAPYQDPYACTGLIGVKRGFSSKAHILRAILEGIAFRFFEMYSVMREETDVHFDPILNVSGGVGNNDFVMELISAMTGCTVHRLADPDTALLGAVYLAGMGAGVWKDKEEIRRLNKPVSTMQPNSSLRMKYEPIYQKWKKAVQRCLNWYV